MMKYPFPELLNQRWYCIAVHFAWHFGIVISKVRINYNEMFPVKDTVQFNMFQIYCIGIRFNFQTMKH